MNNYQHGKIYQITDNKNQQYYIGSVARPLINRWTQHVNSYLHNRNVCSVKDIFNTYGINNCSIQLIEEYPCNSRTELTRREGEVIKEMRARGLNIVNKILAGRTRKEHYIDNKQIINTNNKAYYIANKQKALAFNKAYYIANKDSILLKKKIQYQNKKINKNVNDNITYTNIIESNIESLLDLMDISTD